ncbi:Nif-specific regulatory protein NifA [Nitrospira defluvii]|uniref:Nif-specific regulatory protein NifA n=1 Tax=Nitrospira defluvii TaxID=330214 RepID=D8PI42_9BACT|nr:Nif-specific regulatory protein NifA [Nitrospira defluvii]
MHNAALNYRTLLSVTNVLNSQRNRQSLFRAVTDQLAKVVRWERAGITVYDLKSDAFRFYAVETNLPKVVLRSDAMIPRAHSAVGWVYDHHQVHVRPHLQRERLFIEDESYLQEGLGRMINLPMVVQEACLGTLNIGSIEAGPPDPADVDFLQQVATQIGFAIAHVNAYEEITRLKEQLARENVYLVEELKANQDFGIVVGRSQAFEQVLTLARQAAPTSATVMVTGETGTGKEVLARAIHERSLRRDRAFVRLNCAALPAGLIESELFGHERGAFTGAEHQRVGRFELADGGTLFLDEVGEMPLEAQAKLLRVLQDGLVDRVGGANAIPVDVRVIAATNADLHRAIQQGRFRSDLYYRLNVFPIHMPPLRERPEDIPILARHFLRVHSRRLKRQCEDFDGVSMERLVQYAWPGNVRELENIVERALILCHERLLRIDPAMVHVRVPPESGPRRTLHDEERHHILQTLTLLDWRIEGPGGAAEQLGLAPSTLRSRMRKLAIRRPSRR